MSFDINLVTLQRDLRKSLSTEELRRNFDSIISQTFALQPPSKLLKGLTPREKLGILKTALLNFETSYAVGLWNQWTQAMFKFADQTLQDQAKQGPKPETSVVKAKSSVKANPAPKETSPVGKKHDAKPKAKPKLPPASKQQKIYDSLYEKANSDKPLFTMSYVKCSSVNCAYCKSLFLNIPLTRCQHKSCGPGSWYPHVGERLWKSIVRYHDKPGAVFTARKVELKENMLPSCIEWKCNDAMSVSDVVSSRGTESVISGSTLRSGSSKRTASSVSYTPPGSPAKRISPSKNRDTGFDWTEDSSDN